MKFVRHKVKFVGHLNEVLVGRKMKLRGGTYDFGRLFNALARSDLW
jgi:hypothetical protein